RALEVALGHAAAAVLGDQHAVVTDHLGVDGVLQVLDLPARPAVPVHFHYAAGGTAVQFDDQRVPELALTQVHLRQVELGAIEGPPAGPGVAALLPPGLVRAQRYRRRLVPRQAAEDVLDLPAALRRQGDQQRDEYRHGVPIAGVHQGEGGLEAHQRLGV